MRRKAGLSCRWLCSSCCCRTNFDRPPDAKFLAGAASFLGSQSAIRAGAQVGLSCATTTLAQSAFTGCAAEERAMKMKSRDHPEAARQIISAIISSVAVSGDCRGTRFEVINRADASGTTMTDDTVGQWDSSYLHAPVLADEIVGLFSSATTILDAPWGAAVTAQPFFPYRGERRDVSRDPDAVKAARDRLAAHEAAGRFRVILGNFAEVDRLLPDTSQKFDGVLADLGVSFASSLTMTREDSHFAKAQLSTCA